MPKLADAPTGIGSQQRSAKGNLYLFPGRSMGTSHSMTLQTIEAIDNALDHGTGNGAQAEVRRTNDTAKAIRNLKERSGFTWDELSRLFGVSRRSLHHWANGGRLNQHHSQLLSRFAAMINELSATDPTGNRSLLMSPTEAGLSRYQRLIDIGRSGATGPGGPSVLDRMEALQDRPEVREGSMAPHTSD